jgi:hypothetical protein
MSPHAPISMDAHRQLFQAYADWRAWTEDERAGILVADWERVSLCQSEKSRLQEVIIKLTHELRSGSDGTDPLFERHLRLIVDELIILETNNGEIIALQREKAEAEKNDLSQSARTLRKIQQGYAPPRSAAWQSYS